MDTDCQEFLALFGITVDLIRFGDIGQKPRSVDILAFNGKYKVHIQMLAESASDEYIVKEVLAAFAQLYYDEKGKKK